MRRNAGLPSIAARLVASLVVFGSTYLVTLIALGRLTVITAFPFTPWLSPGAAAVATGVAIFLCENGRWPLGLVVPLRSVLRDAGIGMAIAVVIIGATDGLVILTAGVRHGLGRGFPWLELFAVFVPAALNEELLFRGYPYQRLRVLGRPAAIALSSLLFAAAHASNDDVTPIALVNVALAGVVFCLVYELRRTLWVPLALHLTWNLVSGPALGFAVSGFPERRSSLVAYSSGPEWLSGGAFGIEGSVWIGIVQLGVIAGLIRTVARRNSATGTIVEADGRASS